VGWTNGGGMTGHTHFVHISVVNEDRTGTQLEGEYLHTRLVVNLY